MEDCLRHWHVGHDAGVAEWLGTGLQSRLHGFESRHSLARHRQLNAISTGAKARPLVEAWRYVGSERAAGVLMTPAAFL
jgi:hypothetical protein